MRLAVIGLILSGVACTCTMPVYEARRNVCGSRGEFLNA